MNQKLVRDNILEIIKLSWRKPIFHIAQEKEYKLELFNKLLEETNEVIQEQKNKEKLKEELWDLLEVFYSILKLENISFDEIESIRKNKLLKNWWFEKRIILKQVLEK